MKEDLVELHRSRGMFRQWPWFLGVFLILVTAWTRLLVDKDGDGRLTCVWIGLGTIAAAIIIRFWWCARSGTSKTMNSVPNNSADGAGRGR
jgi:hypothetical protein